MTDKPTMAQLAKVHLVDFDGFDEFGCVMHQTDNGYTEIAFPDGSALRVRVQIL